MMYICRYVLTAILNVQDVLFMGGMESDALVAESTNITAGYLCLPDVSLPFVMSQIF